MKTGPYPNDLAHFVFGYETIYVIEFEDTAFILH